MRNRRPTIAQVVAIVVALIAVAGAGLTIRAHSGTPAPEFCGEAGFGPHAPTEPSPRAALDVALLSNHLDTRRNLAHWRKISDTSCGPTFCRAGVTEAYSANQLPGGWAIQGVDLTGALSRSCHG